MQVGDIVRMLPRRYPKLKNGIMPSSSDRRGWENLTDKWKGTLGIITEQYSKSDEALFIMMTHDPAKKSIETIIVQEHDVEVIRECG